MGGRVSAAEVRRLVRSPADPVASAAAVSLAVNLASPKSAILTWMSAAGVLGDTRRLKRMLPGLMSLCSSCMPCKYCNPYAT